MPIPSDHGFGTITYRRLGSVFAAGASPTTDESHPRVGVIHIPRDREVRAYLRPPSARVWHVRPTHDAEQRTGELLRLFP